MCLCACLPWTYPTLRGTQVTARNWLNKLWRYTIVPTKELYLPFMFSGLPTNYLMVRCVMIYDGMSTMRTRLLQLPRRG